LERSRTGEGMKGWARERVGVLRETVGE